MANAGVGFVWPFSNWGRLTGDVRYRWDDNRGNFGSGGSFGDWIASVGLQIPLGPPPRVAEAPRPAPPAPAETRGEGPPASSAPEETSGTAVRAFRRRHIRVRQGDAHRHRTQPDRESGAGPPGRGRHGHVDGGTGYTDPIGKADSNQRLSLERANAVRDHMVKQGVPAGIIRTEGRGEADLKVTEADCKKEGRS